MIKICDVCNKKFSTEKLNKKRCSPKCSKKGKAISSSKAVSKRRKKVAQLVKEYLGNECCICKYNKCDWALEAHHVFEEKKEFALSVRGLTRSLEKTLNEAGKCVLLCANCHREYHAGLIKKEELIEILNTEQEARKSRMGMLLGGKKKLERHLCKCGVEVSYKGATCVKCFGKSRQKIDWPKTEELLKMVKKTSYTTTAKKLGVSDNAIRKRIINHPL